MLLGDQTMIHIFLGKIHVIEYITQFVAGSSLPVLKNIYSFYPKKYAHVYEALQFSHTQSDLIRDSY